MTFSYLLTNDSGLFIYVFCSNPRLSPKLIIDTKDTQTIPKKGDTNSDTTQRY